MDPYQFLLLAEWMLKEQAHPAGCRSAVSRAYYAAHHCLKDFVEAAGVNIRKSGEAHADVWNHLSQTSDAELEQIGYDLSELQSARIDADYRLQVKDIEGHSTARAHCLDAREMFETVRKVRADQARFERVKRAIVAANRKLRGT